LLNIADRPLIFEMEKPRMAERIALVTGAGSGIGRATALALVAAGWRTIIVGRRLDPLQTTVNFAGSDGNVVAMPCDVSDAEQVQSLFSRVQRDFGRLDLLFNNAGTAAKGAPIDEVPVEVWLQVVNVNLTGSFLCARSAFALMRRQNPRGGRIINNGSVSAQVPRPGSVPYTATKHAITGLTKSLALDGRPYDIACGQIDIGNALTEMAVPITSGVPQADGSIRPEATIDPKYVAEAVVYMANLPLDANVLFMTVMATKMPLVGRG
jgi:NAD(P)-dependent dehydrogenase (short-subunit alcohol dehydrogenase family)